jgi:hypothetical protein
MCNITVCVNELVGCKVHDFVVNWKICASSSGHLRNTTSTHSVSDTWICI